MTCLRSLAAYWHTCVMCIGNLVMQHHIRGMCTTVLTSGLPSLSCLSQQCPLIPLPDQNTSAHHLQVACSGRSTSNTGVAYYYMVDILAHGLTKGGVFISRRFGFFQGLLKPASTLSECSEKQGVPAARTPQGGQAHCQQPGGRPHPRPQAVREFESQTMGKLAASLTICSPTSLLVKFCDGLR